MTKSNNSIEYSNVETSESNAVIDLWVVELFLSSHLLIFHKDIVVWIASTTVCIRPVQSETMLLIILGVKTDLYTLSYIFAEPIYCLYILCGVGIRLY